MSAAVFHSLPDGLRDARQIAGRLGLDATEIVVHAFPDGEIRVTVTPSAPVGVVYASLNQPNDKILALLLAAEAFRRNGARRLVLVSPYLCYMRQDAAFHPGEAIGQKVVGRLLAQAFDRVVTVDAHLHRVTDLRTVFPGIEADNLSAIPVIAEMLRASGVEPGTIAVGPDAESEVWVRDLAERLGIPYLVAVKTRHGDRAVAVALPDPACVTGRPILLIDDVVSSGGTLTECARVLFAAGAASIDVVATHALFSPDSAAAFERAGIRSVRSTTSVPHPTNAISLDVLLANALRTEI